MKKVSDFNLKDKRVLVRCDFNVPLSDRGLILDDFRLRKTVPTIKYLAKEGGRIVLMSHLGDPSGQIIETLRLTSVKNQLMKYLNLKIRKTDDCIGSEVEEMAKRLQPGEILLLENLRFHKEEEENSENFAKELSRLGDIYINDAFSVCHRAHASIVGVPKYLPSGAGFLLEKEIQELEKLVREPEKPLIVIIGGKKAKDKVKVIDNLSTNADFILLGGLIEKEINETGIRFSSPQKIILPVDSVDTFDIGPRTVKLFQEKINLAKTIFWSGPLGMIEKKKFSKGSEKISRAIVESGAFSVVGGGETVEFINRIGLTDKFNHVSTGGGAMLVFLSGEKLPGIEVLK